MYKRRFRTVGQSGPSSQVSTSSSSSVGFTSTVSRRPPSPKNMFDAIEMNSDIFEDSPSPEKRIAGSLSSSPLNGRSPSRPSQQVRDTTTARRILEALMSPEKEKKGTNKSQQQNTKVPAKLRNYMEEVIDKAGITLSIDGTPNILRSDKGVFIQNMNREFTGGRGESGKRIEAFLNDMVEYFSDLENLKIALSPTINDPDCALSHGNAQDCLVRLLLSVDCLQAKLVELLSEKISELISESSHVEENMVGLVRMILAPMRCMNFVSEPETFTKTLMDIVHLSVNSKVVPEIISCIPDIISDDQHTDVANDFISLMKNEPLLTPSVLVALENLCLDSEALYNIQVNLIKSLRKAPVEQVPVYVRLIITGACPKHIDELINGLRSELAICQPAGCLTQGKFSNEEELSTAQMLVFDRLKDVVLKSRKLTDAWIKNISKVKNTSKHKPIDFVMLLILHCTTIDLAKKKAVEALFRAKIRAEEFNETLIRDTFSTLPGIIIQYFEVLLKVTSMLLQSVDPIITKFAASIYEQCFGMFDNHWCKMMLIELLDQIRMWGNNSKAILSVLHSLTTKHRDKVLPHAARVFLLLDSVIEFSVVEVRLLMDVICMIVFSESDTNLLDMSSFQNEIFMIIQKQLTCPDVNVFCCGIICAIMAIKHMATLRDNVPNDTPLESEEDSLILTERSMKALKLLEMTMVSTRSSPEAQVLAFDQLSHVIMSSENLDKVFVRKLSLFMQTNLQNYYIIAQSDFKKKKDGLNASLQYCIDDDIEDPIVLHLTDSVTKEETSMIILVSCVALPALVRVIRSLELADLTEIDALLGCALAMPDPSLTTTFGTLDIYIQKLVLNCLFHACNWFREIINSFVYLIKEGRPEKVLMRLRAVVHLQSLISNCLPLAISYDPPNYYFNTSPTKCRSITEKLKKAGGRRKMGRRKTGCSDRDGNDEQAGGTAAIAPEETTMDIDLEDGGEDEPVASSAPVEMAALRQHLRELDFDVCLILTQPLEMLPKPPKDGMFTPEFGPNELLLVLEDLHAKLKFVLEAKRPFPGGGRGGSLGASTTIGFINLATVRIELIVRNFSKLSQHLTNHLHKLVEYSHNLIRMHDDIWDAPSMFAPGTAEVKKCFALILDCFKVYFSWSGLKCEAHKKLLWKALSYLSGAGKGNPSYLGEVLESCIIYLIAISKCVLDLASGVSLVLLITSLKAVAQDHHEKVNADIGAICDTFLKRHWYDANGNELKCGPQVNQQLSSLVDAYLLDDRERCLARVTGILDWFVEEAQELGNKSSFVTYPHFNKLNMNVLVRSLCKGLVFVLKNSSELKDCGELLKMWDCVMTCLQNIVKVIKAQDTKLNLRIFLKGCLPILRLFLSQGMAIFSVMFKMESLVVPQLLKKLQVVTRYIQTVCNYSKVSKDSLIIQQLPVVRSLLENILLSVKNMVVKNKCTDAFFMGSMKNKDLKGEVIQSQDDEDEEEETSHTAGVTEIVSSSNDDDNSNSESIDAVSDIC